MVKKYLIFVFLNILVLSDLPKAKYLFMILEKQPQFKPKIIIKINFI